MCRSIIQTVVVFAASATFSSAAVISFFDHETAWLATAGAVASDVSSQDYDSATVVDGTYTTSGGTGGAVNYTLATNPSRTVALSTNNDFETGTMGQGIFFNTLAGTGSASVDTATMTINTGDVFSFSFNVHDLFDTRTGTYGFKVEIKLVGEAIETVFDTGNAIAGIGGNSSASVAYTGPGGSTGSRILGDDSNADVGEDGAFFGFTSTSALESITLTKTTVDDRNDNWAFDEFNVVSTPAIPEPSSTTALLGLGSLALILRRRK